VSELGKFGKLIGETHPRDRRKTDPEPLRATPAKTGRKVRRPFGYAVEFRMFSTWPWETVTRWYATAARRDQAMHAEARRIEGLDWYRNLRAIERAPDHSDLGR